jgi:hypothetical protein
LEARLLTVDPVAARLYACRVAESVMHHYTERYPGDDSCARVLAADRRFAAGTLSEWGRRRAATAARKMEIRAEGDTGCFS